MTEEAKPISQGTGGAVESAGGMQADRPRDREHSVRATEPAVEEYIRDVYRSLTDLGTDADRTVDTRFLAAAPAQNAPPPVKVTQPGTSAQLAGSPVGKSYRGLAIVSLVCGIVSLIIAGMIAGPAAVIVGVIARKGMRTSSNRAGYGMALAGIIIGAIGAVLALVLIVVGAGR